MAPERATFNADYADLAPTAERFGVPVHRIRNIKDPETIDLIRSLRPDVIFVFGWSQIVTKPVLDIPPLGCIGTHPALLPKNRGRHPLIWALVEGLTESGLTFFYLDEGADSGDILWQKPFPITIDDTARTLYDKIVVLGREAIREFLPLLANGTAPRIPQDDSKATYWRKRGESDGQVRWSGETMTAYNLIRALTHPYVGAHTYLDGRKVQVWRAELPEDVLPSNADDAPPGSVFRRHGGGIDVRTGDGYLTLVECEGAPTDLDLVGTRFEERE